MKRIFATAFFMSALVYSGGCDSLKPNRTSNVGDPVSISADNYVAVSNAAVTSVKNGISDTNQLVMVSDGYASSRINIEPDGIDIVSDEEFGNVYISGGPVSIRAGTPGSETVFGVNAVTGLSCEVAPYVNSNSVMNAKATDARYLQTNTDTAFVSASDYISLYSESGNLIFSAPSGNVSLRGSSIAVYGNIDMGGSYSINLDNSELIGPEDPTSGDEVGDRDYNDSRYLQQSAGWSGTVPLGTGGSLTVVNGQITSYTAP